MHVRPARRNTLAMTRVPCQALARRARVAIVTTAQQDVMGLRRELLPWMAYHLHIGVSHFYVRYASIVDVHMHSHALVAR